MFAAAPRAAGSSITRSDLRHPGASGDTAFAGRRGLAHCGAGEFQLAWARLTNHRQIQRSFETVSPDPARVDDIAVMLADAFAKANRWWRCRLRCDPKRREQRREGVHRAFSRSRAHRTLDGKASSPKTIRCQSACSETVPCQRLEAFYERRCRRGHRNAFNPARDIHYWKLCSTPHAGPHHISEANRQVHKADDALVADAQLAAAR